MFFGNDRDALRAAYRDAWRKHVEGRPLEPLEAALADVIAAHPEYHGALDENALDRDYLPERGESNPFLHMGMHMALREQVSTDRPAGIAAVHRALATRLGDGHEAEHRMMECLGEALWQAQRSGTAPDEAAYMDCLKRL